jgi:hypothetical protein
MQRSRAGLVALAAAVIVLLAVIATGNQGLTDYFQRHSGSGSRIFQDVRLSINAFPWRFWPRSGESAIYTGQLVGIGVLVVLTFLFVLAIARGVVTFGRVLFGTWFAVVTAGVFAVMVRGLFISPQASHSRININSNQVAYGLFEGPGGPSLAFVLACGLITGLVTALVATMTARPIEPTPGGPVVVGVVGAEYPTYQQPAQPFDQQGQPYGVQPQATEQPAPAYEPKQSYWTDHPEQTQVFGPPSEGQPESQPTEEPPADSEQTTSLPRYEPGGPSPTATLPEVPPEEPSEQDPESR